MKKKLVNGWIAAFCVFFFPASYLCAQDSALVLRIQGKATEERRGRLLHPGDWFHSGDVLHFQSSRDCIVLREKNGAIRTYRPGQVQTVQGQRNWLLAAADIWGPATKMVPTSIRNGLIPDVLALEALLEQEHQVGRNFLLCDSLRFALARHAFPIDTRHYFLLRFSYRGEEIYKHTTALPPRGDTSYLCIGPEVFRVDGKPFEPDSVEEVEVIYRNDVEQSSLPVAFTNIRYVPRPQLLRSLASFRTELIAEQVAAPASRDALVEYLLAGFGRPDEATREALLHAAGAAFTTR